MAAPPIVQQAWGNNGGSSSTTPSLAMTTAPTNGNAIVVMVAWNAAIAAPTISDTRGSTWVTEETPATGNLKLMTATAKNIAGSGANTVTFTFATALVPRMYICEVSGGDTTDPSEQKLSATGSSTTASSGNVATTVTDQLIFGFIHSGVTQTYTGASLGAGYTLQQSDARTMVETKAVTAAGNYAADTATAALVTGAWIASVLTIKAAAGAVSMSGTPANVVNGATGKVISLVGVATNWVAQTFTVQSGPATKTAQAITDTTHASITLTITGTGTITLTDGTITCTINALAAASTYTFTGPTSGAVSVASTNFTVALPAATGVVTAVIITPADGGGGGTFSPTTVTLPIDTSAPSATFTYTPGSAGTKTLSVTNNGGLTNPSTISYVAGASSTTIAVNDANIDWSLNWELVSARMRSGRKGAIGRMGISGTRLIVNVLHTGNTAGATNWPRMKVIIDSVVYTHLFASGETTWTVTTTLANVAHTVEWVIDAIGEAKGGTPVGGDRWTPLNRLEIVSFTVDTQSGATALAARDAVCLFYSQSDAAGEKSNGETPAAGDSITKTSFYWAREWLNWDVSYFCDNGIGLTLDGEGGIPRIYDPANLATSSWNKISSVTNIDFATVGIVVIEAGGNDARTGVPTATIAAAYVAFVQALLGAKPTLIVILSVLTNQLTLAAMVSAYATLNDSRVRLNIPPVRAAYGLDGLAPAPSTGATQKASDLPHPGLEGWTAISGHLAIGLYKTMNPILRRTGMSGGF